MPTFIPLLDLRQQYSAIENEIREALEKVLGNQRFILGEEVASFEKGIARYCQTKYAIGVGSGTDALILSLKALDIGEGDEVITSPFTFFATAEAVSLAGARPVFVDIDPKTYTINPGLIEDKISEHTKAIIPVHLYGQCADMDPIVKIAKKYNLKIIEDAAQAIGAAYKGRIAGSMGEIGALSFYPSKNLGAFGDAGMAVTNDKDAADKIRMLRFHGSSQRYVHSMIGANSRVDNIQAAVLRVKLKYLDGWLEKRRENAEFYNANLKGLPLIFPYVPDYNVHTYHQYVLRSHSDKEHLMKFLIEGGVETRTYYPVPLHLQECYRSLGYKKGDLKESEAAAEETFAIPVYPELKRKELEYIVERIKGFYGDTQH